MVHCIICRTHLKGGWDIKAKNDTIELGLSSVFLIAGDTGGRAMVYCRRCYDVDMWKMYDAMTLSLGLPQAQLKHIPLGDWDASNKKIASFEQQTLIKELEYQGLLEKHRVLSQAYIKLDTQHKQLKQELARTVENYQRLLPIDFPDRRTVRDAPVRQPSEPAPSRVTRRVFGHSTIIRQKEEFSVATSSFESALSLELSTPHDILSELNRRGLGLEATEKQLVRKIHQLTVGAVEEYRGNVRKVHSEYISENERELALLESIRSSHEAKAEASGLYTAEEVEEGVAGTVRKITDKKNRLDELHQFGSILQSVDRPL